MTAPDGRLTVLITRPGESGEALTGALESRGYAVLHQPMLSIDFVAGPPLAVGGVQALLFTSANGVRAFVRRCDRRDVPALAVGDATAAEALRNGFDSVESAGGDVRNLAALAKRRLDPARGKLLHPAGSAVAGDLGGLLAAAGFVVDRQPLYLSRRTEALEPAIRNALEDGAIDAALFFSPRTAAAFASVVQAAGLDEACSEVTACCLSDAVAEALSPLAWRGLAVAAEPNRENLLAALDRTVTDTGKDDSPADTAGSFDLLRSGKAREVVDRFGGIRPMAAKLGVPVTTVQGWKARDHIPGNRFEAVRAAAQVHAVDLTDEDALRAAEEAAETESAQTEPASAPSTGRIAGATERAQEARTPPGPAAASPQTVRVARAALAVALVAVAGVASHPLWSPLRDGGAGPAEDLAARTAALESRGAASAGLSARLDRIERRIATVSDGLAETGAAHGGGEAALGKIGDELTAARASLNMLTRRLGAAEGGIAQASGDAASGLERARREIAALGETLAALGDRVAALEARPRGGGAQVAALAVATGQLESAVFHGLPYRAQLDRLRGLAAGDEAMTAPLAALDARADAGVPSSAMLAKRFARIAPDLAPPKPKSESGGWLPRLRDKTMALIRMRPVGEEGESSPITRAERAVAREDLPAAIVALKGVGGPAEEWLAAAASRIAAEKSLNALRKRLADMLVAEAAAEGPSDSGPKPPP